MACLCGHNKIYAKKMCRRCYEKDLRQHNPAYAERQRINSRNWQKNNPEKKRLIDQKRYADPIKRKRDALTGRRSLLKRLYNITLEDYNKLLEKQNGVCAICKKKFDVALDVDHDHNTGEIRGLLCRGCNTLLGHVERRSATLFNAGRYLCSKGGTKKDDGKLAFAALPVNPLMQVVDVYTIGMKKYGLDNWRDGILYNRIFSAMQRHAWKWWNGEELDQEDGQHHLASVAWTALTLLEYLKTHPELDDRPKKE